jgi:hypothetical protein
MKLIFIISILLAISCNISRKVCLRDWINHSKCVYISKGQITPNRYFIFNSQSYKEYVDGKLYAISNVRWESCDKYLLVVQKLYDEDNVGIKQGDTLKVNIIFAEKDTLTCIASGLNFSIEIKFLRVSKLSR